MRRFGSDFLVGAVMGLFVATSMSLSPSAEAAQATAGNYRAINISTSNPNDATWFWNYDNATQNNASSANVDWAVHILELA